MEKCAYYVNKLRQNVGLETGLWRQFVTSQTAHTKYKWLRYAAEWNPHHEKFLRTPLFDTQVQMQYYSTDGFKLANKPTGKDETAVSEQLKETTE